MQETRIERPQTGEERQLVRLRRSSQPLPKQPGGEVAATYRRAVPFTLPPNRAKAKAEMLRARLPPLPRSCPKTRYQPITNQAIASTSATITKRSTASTRSSLVGDSDVVVWVAPVAQFGRTGAVSPHARGG